MKFYLFTYAGSEVDHDKMADIVIDIETKLREWGFASYIEKFQDEEVSFDDLLCISEATLSSIITKAGPRTRLLKLLAQHRQQLTPHIPEPSELGSNTSASDSADIYQGDGETSTSTDFEAVSTASNQNINLQSSLTSGGSSSSSLSTTSTVVSTVTSGESSSSNLSTTSAVVSTVASGGSSSSNLSTTSTVDLRSILQQYSCGPALLKSRVLDEQRRKQLVELLADHLIVKYGNPSRRTYESYSKAITDIYPAEQAATYFIPSMCHQTPSGKLYFKVVNLNYKRRQLGDDDKTGKGKRSKKPLQTDLGNMLELNDEPVESIERMKLWLQTKNRPESQLLDYWRKTAKDRLQFIHGDTTQPLSMICQQWPRYKDKDGHVLISEDFAILYPEAVEKLSMAWPQMYNKVLDRLRRKNVKDKVIQQLLDCVRCNYEQPRSPEVEMAFALRFLPILLAEAPLPVSVPGKRKRNSWRPTAMETMDNFVDVKTNINDLKTYLEEKAETLAHWGCQLQPHVVVLASGDNFDEFYSCYACIHSSVFYETATLVEAVDIAFKAAFVLGLQYPPPAHSSWAFLQKAAYQISSRFDRIPSRVYELITDLK